LAENLNIVVTSKPVDGLLYYSYEYCSYLNDQGINARVVIICHKNFSKDDYINAISTKYIHCKNIEFDNYQPTASDITLVMGRSMMTLAWQNFRDYRKDQKETLQRLFSNKIIAVYSENHPIDYPKAVEFFSPNEIIDLCDTEVYPNGVGEHFEKTINFEIYKPHIDDIKFKYLFLGTNKKYYETVQKVIGNYSDHGILTYNEGYIDIRNNNVFAPVENLMGMFETYVYTKDTFDPAPRIFQECKYFGKDVIYLRDPSIIDGGSVYWKRDIKQLNVTPILNSIEKFK
jgi:hypothetical protein